MHNLDNRKDTRVATQDPAAVMMLDSPRSVGFGTLVNVSRNGVLIRLSGCLKLPAGCKIAVTLRGAKILGRVKHTSDVSGGMLLGVLIEDVEYDGATSHNSDCLYF